MSDKTVQADLFDETSSPEDQRRPPDKDRIKSCTPTAPSRGEADEAFLAVGQIMQRYGIGRATVWRWVKVNPDFPEPMKLSSGISRWRQSDLVAFDRAMEKRSIRKRGVASGRSPENSTKRSSS